MVVQQGVVADTYDSLIYRGYGGDDALRAVAAIPPATHKMSLTTWSSDISLAYRPLGVRGRPPFHAGTRAGPPWAAA